MATFSQHEAHTWMRDHFHHLIGSVQNILLSVFLILDVKLCSHKIYKHKDILPIQIRGFRIKYKIQLLPKELKEGPTEKLYI